MKKGQKIRRRRKFSEEFKRQVVQEFESKQFSVSELSRLHEISFQSIYRWIYRYSMINKPKTIMVEFKDSSTRKLKAYEKKIEQLERALGQKQLRIDFLEQVIQQADHHYQADLKKNFDSKW